ncbi:MAG: glutamate racemase [Caldicoprobacter oshimai]|uniref:Glutamate racemase n=1 Tax=Caldicoprobacter faecalis TaxID=937334 RepID=A0A1I5VXX4_9FIRM|nr:glutamate racemase [Caldicoprobacter faecalis]PZN11968.1 MAG: glutamate racemase [Caldicoprobacter oshimai]SFQ12325.1 glutamate racemase [Caldicoprobacter faecalis]
MDHRPIGVFDSGLGGLTVVKELMAQLPNENIVYFGDTARLPYGTRSKETIIKYSMQCIRFLLTQNIKAVVIACNTASSMALDAVKEVFDIPIIGVVEPGAAAAVRATRNGKVGIIGTEATVQSGSYSRTIAGMNANIHTCSVACSLFVPIVEEGWSDTPIAYLTAEKYLAPLREWGADTLILGCTHYPLLINTISKVMGPDVALINPAVDTAQEVKRILEQRGMLNESDKEPQYLYYLSDFSQRFKQIGSRFLNREIEYAGKVDIENY